MISYPLLGVMVGLVSNIDDPKKENRIKVQLPRLDEKLETDWIRCASPWAGKDRGFYALPEVGDEVLLAFEFGDINQPIVIGQLWNGKDKAPADNGKKKNNIKMLKSRSGHQVILNDESGKETIELIDKGKKSKIVFDCKKKTITIESEKDIMIKAPKGKITVQAKKDILIGSAKNISLVSAKKISLIGKEIELAASKKLAVQGKPVEIKSDSSAKVEASQKLDLKSNAEVVVKGSMIKLN